MKSKTIFQVIGNHEFIIDILSEWMDSFNGQMIFSIGGLENVLDKKIPHSTLLMETELNEKDLAESLHTLKKEILSSDGRISLERDEISESLFTGLIQKQIRKKIIVLPYQFLIKHLEFLLVEGIM